MKSYSEYNDNELVEMLTGAKGDKNMAFLELYNRYSAMVRAYCMCVIQNKDHAEDIFQETFVSFFRNVSEGTEIKNVRAYLIGISRNMTYNYRRNKKITVPVELDMLVTDERSRYEKTELMDIIVRSLSLLDLKYRESFILREFQGLSFKEIADVCDITVSGAKSRVQRAHKKLVKILSPYLKDLSVNK